MAKMETLEREITCACGIKGSAWWQETENPAHNNWKIDSTEVNIAGPFHLNGGHAESAKFTCQNCGTEAINGPVKLSR
ncbi:hypothetical protein [Sphingobium cupriresistens]|uniref:hypothetical protein n=1 Tax=Sphingobium cupriresistens TaxID=1132417 RepID=UPI000A7562D0|nr:hypothetical protein [Sphingobium cupriresistens]